MLVRFKWFSLLLSTSWRSSSGCWSLRLAGWWLLSTWLSRCSSSMYVMCGLPSGVSSISMGAPIASSSDVATDSTAPPLGTAPPPLASRRSVSWGYRLELLFGEAVAKLLGGAVNWLSRIVELGEEDAAPTPPSAFIRRQSMRLAGRDWAGEMRPEKLFVTWAGEEPGDGDEVRSTISTTLCCAGGSWTGFGFPALLALPAAPPPAIPLLGARLWNIWGSCSFDSDSSMSMSSELRRPSSAAASAWSASRSEKPQNSWLLLFDSMPFVIRAEAGAGVGTGVASLEAVVGSFSSSTARTLCLGEHRFLMVSLGRGWSCSSDLPEASSSVRSMDLVLMVSLGMLWALLRSCFMITV